MDLLQRISWAAVISVLCMLSAVVSAVLSFELFGIVLGCCSISWALLSLKDLTR